MAAERCWWMAVLLLAAAATAAPSVPQLKPSIVVTLRSAAAAPDEEAVLALVQEMTTWRGERFKCSVRQAGEVPSSAPREWDAATAGIEAGLLLKNHCADKPMGYWTFKVCAGGSIRQTHEAESILVGSFDASQEPSSQAKPLTAEQLFSRGDACLDGTPRSAKVTYSCNRNADTLTVDSVVEGPTCHYSISASSYVLCASSIFALPEPVTDDILCFPLADSAAESRPASSV